MFEKIRNEIIAISKDKKYLECNQELKEKLLKATKSHK